MRTYLSLSTLELENRVAFHRHQMTCTVAGPNEHKAQERNDLYQATNEIMADTFQELLDYRKGETAERSLLREWRDNFDNFEEGLRTPIGGLVRKTRELLGP